ncbi:MAG: SprT-like domain-containing protein [Acidobacteriota bacterium]
MTKTLRQRRRARRLPSQLSDPALRLVVLSYLRRLGEQQRAARVRVVFNGRMRTAIGRCEPGRGRIYLNPRLLDRYPAELVPTIVHELCHVVAGLRAGHGPRWQELMRRCGFKPDLYHDLDVSAFESHRRSWRWRCRACGYAYIRKTRSANSYRCGSCGGRLDVESEMRQRQAASRRAG